MHNPILVLGTRTGVGKTWVTAAVARELRAAGYAVAARKPVQSFDPSDPEPRDSDILAAATGEYPETVCSATRSYAVALAPPIAAGELGLPDFTIDELAGEIAPAPQGATTLIEGVGGPLSPVAADGDNTDLAAALAPSLVVLVGPAELGAINEILLARRVLSRWNHVVFVNRFDQRDPTHRLNVEWLRNHGTPLYTDVGSLVKALPAAPSTNLSAGRLSEVT